MGPFFSILAANRPFDVVSTKKWFHLIGLGMTNLSEFKELDFMYKRLRYYISLEPVNEFRVFKF